MSDLTILPNLYGDRARLWSTPLVRLATANMDVFVSLVIRQRTALGFSQREVGRRAGLTVAAVREMEIRKYGVPKLSTILAVADTLAITADDIRAELAAMADREMEGAS